MSSAVTALVVITISFPLKLIFLPGFSTAEKITSVSGRGVGLDVVKTHVERIGGSVTVSSRPGRGCTFLVRIPLTLAIVPALIVRVGTARYAIPQGSVLEVVRRHWKIAAYSALLMAAFNFFSHGSQDAYPNLFLKGQHHFDTRLSSFMTGIANLGAICGGLCFGALSQRIGRRRAILIASLLALPAVPFWAFGTTPLILGAGAFFVQVAVQGAWGVIPVHLNELAPAEIRGTFGGFVYQLGNLLAASNLNLQVAIAEAHANDYGLAMAIVVATVPVL